VQYIKQRVASCQENNATHKLKKFLCNDSNTISISNFEALVHNYCRHNNRLHEQIVSCNLCIHVPHQVLAIAKFTYVKSTIQMDLSHFVACVCSRWRYEHK